MLLNKIFDLSNAWIQAKQCIHAPFKIGFDFDWISTFRIPQKAELSKIPAGLEGVPGMGEDEEPDNHADDGDGDFHRSQDTLPPEACRISPLMAIRWQEWTSAIQASDNP